MLLAKMALIGMVFQSGADVNVREEPHCYDIGEVSVNCQCDLPFGRRFLECVPEDLKPWQQRDHNCCVEEKRCCHDKGGIRVY